MSSKPKHNKPEETKEEKQEREHQERMDRILELGETIEVKKDDIIVENIEKNKPKKHNEGTIVCSHWLLGMCKKGEDCPFLHQRVEDKIPLCDRYRKFGLFYLSMRCSHRIH